MSNGTNATQPLTEEAVAEFLKTKGRVSVEQKDYERKASAGNDLSKLRASLGEISPEDLPKILEEHKKMQAERLTELERYKADTEKQKAKLEKQELLLQAEKTANKKLQVDVFINRLMQEGSLKILDEFLDRTPLYEADASKLSDEEYKKLVVGVIDGGKVKQQERLKALGVPTGAEVKSPQTGVPTSGVPEEPGVIVRDTQKVVFTQDDLQRIARENTGAESWGLPPKPNK